ncbi:Mitotic-spindle organizing protein 1 [Mucor flavus]|uniref:Mitotic-spindle organizing protein 1 n=1 Tax=Mucor flavus TaxID=439312 RepID=A0ABP9YP99_9FUNG
MESTRNDEVKETIDLLLEMATLLNTGLDRETLGLCVSLCERGVNPEALASVIKDLRKQELTTTESNIH